jgi:hypothetical protein
MPPPASQQHDQQPALEQQQQQAGSGASSPRSLLAARRPSLQRPGQEAAGGAARSPSLAPLDSGSTLRSYALRIGDQPLVRVSLHPPLEGSLQPGSTLAGTLDFSQAVPADGGQPGAGPTPRCMQVLILLETEEIVEQPWRRQVAGGGGVIRRVHDEHLELTGDTGCTHFLFTIPPDAPPSFQTPLMQLRWLLRFQFTAALPPPGGKAAADWSPLQGKLEQLTWALPITVLPPSA